MSAATLLGIGLLGGLGAVLRVALTAAVAAREGGGFAWGTLAVNLAGTLALGALVGAGLQGDALRLAATGLIASFTTFSTWALESHRLGRRAGAANLGAALVLGLGAVWLGRELGALL